MIPAAVILPAAAKRHDPDARFDQPPGQQE